MAEAISIQLLPTSAQLHSRSSCAECSHETSQTCTSYTNSISVERFEESTHPLVCPVTFVDVSVSVCPSGPLSIPTVPSIPGLQDFKGTTMHTAAWDSSIELAGKKVSSTQYIFVSFGCRRRRLHQTCAGVYALLALPRTCIFRSGLLGGGVLPENIHRHRRPPCM